MGNLLIARSGWPLNARGTIAGEVSRVASIGSGTSAGRNCSEIRRTTLRQASGDPVEDSNAIGWKPAKARNGRRRHFRDDSGCRCRRRIERGACNERDGCTSQGIWISAAEHGRVAACAKGEAHTGAGAENRQRPIGRARPVRRATGSALPRARVNTGIML